MRPVSLRAAHPVPLAVALVVLVFGVLVSLFGWWTYISAVCTLDCPSSDPSCCMQMIANEHASALGIMVDGSIIALLGCGLLIALVVVGRMRVPRPPSIVA